jgi:hypothetical protein
MVDSNLTACHVLNLTLMGFCTVMEENGKPSDVFGCLSISQTHYGILYFNVSFGLKYYICIIVYIVLGK